MFDSKPCTIMIDIQIHLTMGSRIEMLKNFGGQLSVYGNFDNLLKISPKFFDISNTAGDNGNSRGGGGVEWPATGLCSVSGKGFPTRGGCC